MLLIISVFLFLGAAAIPARWLVARHDSLGRPRPFPWISTGLLLVLAIAALTPGLLRARLEDRLADAAGELIGMPVSVHCQGFGEAFVDAHSELGYVPFGPDGTPMRETLIKRNQCRDLSAYLRSGKERPSQDQIVAVHVLTHEAMHMRGSTNEAETECFAMQHNSEMAELLGASPEAARQLAVAYWVTVYPRMPADYRTDDCGPQKSLDLGSPGAPWATDD